MKRDLIDQLINFLREDVGVNLIGRFNALLETSNLQLTGSLKPIVEEVRAWIEAEVHHNPLNNPSLTR